MYRSSSSDGVAADFSFISKYSYTADLDWLDQLRPQYLPLGTTSTDLLEYTDLELVVSMC